MASDFREIFSFVQSFFRQRFVSLLKVVKTGSLLQTLVVVKNWTRVVYIPGNLEPGFCYLIVVVISFKQLFRAEVELSKTFMDYCSHVDCS